MKFTEAITTYIPLILYITILWLCSEYIVIPYCGFFLYGWVSTTVWLVGDAVVGVSI